MSLEPGEKYLSIKLDLGVLGEHIISVFPNKDVGKKENSPDFKSKYAAVWVNKKRTADKSVVSKENVVVEDVQE